MDAEQIQQKLKEMLEADLQKRNELIKKGTLFDGYHPEMEEIHVRNSKQLEQIIDEFGYPTAGTFGKEAAAAAWTIVMHSISNPPFMKKVLAMLQSPQYKDEVDPKDVAYLEDRIRVFEGKPQKYGTQFDWDENHFMSPYPIENIEKVNELREQIGLLPIEEQTKIMRERARKEGEKPPENIEKKLKEKEEWARRVGWI